VENWGTTDSARPREVVEVIVALGSAGAFTAVVSALKHWLDRKKFKRIELKGPGGTLVMEGATAEDVAAVAKAVGFQMS
jgi:hypothetical protein